MKKKILRVRKCSFTDDVGGVGVLRERPKRGYRVEVVYNWYIQATGIYFTGRLVDTKDIETVRQTGTTGYKPSDYRKYGAEFELWATASHKTFDPSKVYFSKFDVIKEED